MLNAKYERARSPRGQESHITRNRGHGQARAARLRNERGRRLLAILQPFFEPL